MICKVEFLPYLFTTTNIQFLKKGMILKVLERKNNHTACGVLAWDKFLTDILWWPWNYADTFVWSSAFSSWFFKGFGKQPHSFTLYLKHYTNNFKSIDSADRASLFVLMESLRFPCHFLKIPQAFNQALLTSKDRISKVITG